MLVAVPIVMRHFANGQQADFLVNVLVIFAVFSDYLDGYVARQTDQVSEWGKVIDPLADKICAGILVFYTVLIGVIPWWFFWFMIGRDLLIAVGGFLIKKQRGKVPMSIWAGKFAVNVLAIYWILAFYFPDQEQLLFFFQGASFAMLFYAFVEYVKHARLILSGKDFN